MTNEILRPTAKIYAFPQRGRTPIRHGGETPEPATGLQARQYAMTACGSGWYHEEAIEEAARQPKDYAISAGELSSGGSQRPSRSR